MKEDWKAEPAALRAAQALFRECGMSCEPRVMVAKSGTEWREMAERAWKLRSATPLVLLVLMCVAVSVFASASIACFYAMPMQWPDPSVATQPPVPVPWHSVFFWPMVGINLALAGSFSHLMAVRPALHLRRAWKRDLDASGIHASDVYLRVNATSRILERARELLIDMLPSAAHKHVSLTVGVSWHPIRMGTMEVAVPVIGTTNYLGWLGHWGGTPGHELRHGEFLSAVRVLHMAVDELVIVGNVVVLLPGRGGGTRESREPQGSSLLDLFLPGWRTSPVKPRAPELV